MNSFLSPALARLVVAVAGCLAAPTASTLAAGLLTIHTFSALTEGNTPASVLVQGADGRLYGTASASGPYGNGSLYSLRTDGSDFTLLSTFPGTNAGSQPRGGLVQARDGNFYGTTYKGGVGQGTLFQLTPDGVQTYLAYFTDGASPGANPSSTPVEGRNGYLYGTAQYGGSNNFGTVYQFAPTTDPSAAALQTTVTIPGDLAGSYPLADLCLGADGRFYGTTTIGGQGNFGVFFRTDMYGNYQLLYNFSGSGDGGTPSRGVVQGRDGAFYGVTSTGGAYQAGTAYRIVVNGDSASLTTLHAFYPTASEGSNPIGLPVVASDGNLYGTATRGGANNNGCVFRVTTGGVYTTVYSFTNTTDGGDPVGGLIQASDGRLYGTTSPVNDANATIYQLDLGLPLPAPLPQALLTSSVAPGGTALIQGRNFVGTTAVTFTAANSQTVAATSFQVLSGTVISAVVPTNAISGTIRVTTNGQTAVVPGTLTVTYGRPAFFAGEVALSNGVYYLQFPNGNVFGYYSYLSDPRYLYHFDLGYEYVFDANDGQNGVYLYDLASGGFFYTSPTYPFPYLYDFSLGSVLYYFPDTTTPGRYTRDPRYFYDFGAGQIITK